MRGSRLGLALWFVLTAASSAAAQALPRDVSVKVDSFTGDTIYSTKYGRLDAPQGCKRENLAIVWRYRQGPTGTREAVTFDFIDLGDGLMGSRGRWLNAVDLILNIDGEFLEGEVPRMGASQLGQSGDRGVTEAGGWWLPPGTLRRVADSRVAKLRIQGTDRTCDGTIEPNMVRRITDLLHHLEAAPAGP